jgi:hypothetical protein
MRVTMLATTAAIALIATVSSVSADQLTTPKQLTTLNGVKAVPMSSAELSAVKGMDHHFTILVSADNPNGVLVGTSTFLDPPSSLSAAPLNDPQGRPRFGTDWKQDSLDGGNFVDVLGASRAPSYLGLRLHACNNAVIGVAGCP